MSVAKSIFQELSAQQLRKLSYFAFLTEFSHSEIEQLLNQEEWKSISKSLRYYVGEKRQKDGKTWASLKNEARREILRHLHKEGLLDRNHILYVFPSEKPSRFNPYALELEREEKLPSIPENCRPQTLLQKTYEKLLLRRATTLSQMMDIDEIFATKQILDWLPDGFTGIPHYLDVQNALDRRWLLESLKLNRDLKDCERKLAEFIFSNICRHESFSERNRLFYDLAGFEIWEEEDVEESPIARYLAKTTLETPSTTVLTAYINVSHPRLETTNFFLLLIEIVRQLACQVSPELRLFAINGRNYCSKWESHCTGKSIKCIDIKSMMTEFILFSNRQHFLFIFDGRIVDHNRKAEFCEFFAELSSSLPFLNIISFLDVELKGVFPPSTIVVAKPQSNTIHLRSQQTRSESVKSRRTEIGIVTSDVRQKTITVELTRRVEHVRYHKHMSQSTKIHVHDEYNDAKIGDHVEVIETRPLSKQKRWNLVKIIKKAEIDRTARVPELVFESIGHY